MGMCSYASCSLKFLFSVPAFVGVRFSSKPDSLTRGKGVDGQPVLLHYHLRKQRFLIDPACIAVVGLCHYAGAADAVWNLSPRR